MFRPIALLPFALVAISAAASDYNPLGVYVGGGVGQARDSYTAFSISDDARTGWKVVAGVRPIPFVGAEVEYVDFGSPDAAAPVGYGPLAGGFNGTARATGEAVFAVGYLPIVNPYFDVYAKAGLERVHTTADGLAGCRPPTLCILGWNADTTDTDFAYGGGFQAQYSSVALRAEYERTSTSVGHPNLLSVGVMWT